MERKIISYSHLIGFQGPCCIVIIQVNGVFFNAGAAMHGLTLWILVLIIRTCMAGWCSKLQPMEKCLN